MAGMFMLSGAMPLSVSAEYCSSGALTRSGENRFLTLLTVTDGTTSVVVPVNQDPKEGSLTYIDETSSVLPVLPGATISFSEISWNGDWMHSYAYVDYNSDGSFNTTLNADGNNAGELVAYSYYNSNTNATTGTDSRGKSYSYGDGVGVDKMPSFTIPENLSPGDYRLRFKIDWNSINPCGATVEKDGGVIVDLTLAVGEPIERTVTVSSSYPEMGSVAITGSDALSVTVAGGVEITATANDGYEFVKWINDATSETFSTDATTMVYGNSDIALTAQFLEEGYDPTIVNLPKRGANGAEIIPLSSMEIEKITIGWGTIKANKSIENAPLKLKGITYTSGVGAHASAKLNVKLNDAVTKFHCVLGIDDEVIPGCGTSTTNGVCDYTVKLVRNDGSENVVSSGVIRNNQEPVVIDIDGLQTYKYLVIDVPEGTGGDSYDHVDFANAYFEYIEQNSTRPIIVTDSEMGGLLRCSTITFSQPGVKYMHKLRAELPTAEITVDELPDGTRMERGSFAG